MIGSFGSPEKMFSINFSKGNTKFCLSLHYNAYNSYLFVNGKENFEFKVDNKIVNFPTQFCPRNISYGFSATESREVYLNGFKWICVWFFNYPFILSLAKCAVVGNVLYPKMCIPKETKDMNAKSFNMITNKN